MSRLFRSPKLLRVGHDGRIVGIRRSLPPLLPQRCWSERRHGDDVLAGQLTKVMPLATGDLDCCIGSAAGAKNGGGGWAATETRRE